VDVLETLKQCMGKYTHVQKSIAPYVDKIWSSLKYEVRNGEITEAVNGTLDVIRAMTARLDGDELRNFVLTVLRECLEDLGNPTYAAEMGKLLVCAAGAKAAAFVMIVTPAVKTVKENLRHTRSNDHRRDLLALLNSILDVRLLFVGSRASPVVGDVDGLKATDPNLVGLYDEVYKPNLDTNKAVSKKAIEGMGLLMCQPSAVAEGLLLLPEAALEDITTTLGHILTDPANDLADDAMVSMQKSCVAWPPALSALLGSSFAHIHTTPSTENAEELMTLLSRLSYVSCSELPKKGNKLEYYVLFLSHLLENMHRSLSNSDGPSQLWIIYPAAVQAAVRYVRDALKGELGADALTAEFPGSISQGSWVAYISSRYPSMPLIDSPRSDGGAGQTIGEESASLPQVDFLLLSLFVTRQLYRWSTHIVEISETSEGSDETILGLSLSDEVLKDGNDGPWRDQYLHFLAALATLVVGQLSKENQARLCLHEDVATLFRGNDTWKSKSSPSEDISYRAVAFRALSHGFGFEKGDLTDIPPSLGSRYLLPASLSLGVLQPLYPEVVRLLVSGLSDNVACTNHSLSNIWSSLMELMGQSS
jgi:DNA repair/transcription protein MET18/MMS19